MATSYSINILKLIGGEVDSQSDVVTSVIYELTGVDGDFTASVNGDIHCDYDADNFTELSNLTEEQVKSWITNDDKNYVAYKNYVDRKIAKKKESINTLTKPW